VVGGEPLLEANVAQDFSKISANASQEDDNAPFLRVSQEMFQMLDGHHVRVTSAPQAEDNALDAASVPPLIRVSRSCVR